MNKANSYLLSLFTLLSPCPFSVDFRATTAACVGDMLYTGTGCQRNYRAAVRYYLRAAHAGDASSANAVGLLHELGRGVTRNMGTASCWYQRAAELG